MLSKSEKSGAIDYKKALLIKKLSKDIINITINGEIIKTTEDHLFMTIEGWKKAIDLKVGEKIITSNNIQNIENIQKVSYNKNIAVYNLELEEYHTFFVGKSSILVHNEYKMPNLKKMYKEYLGKLPEGVDRKKFENLLNRVEKSGDIKLLEELESKLSNLNGDFGKFDNVVKEFDLTLIEGVGKAESKQLVNGPYIKNGKPNGRPTASGKKKLQFEKDVYNDNVDLDGILRDPNTGEVINWKPGQQRKNVVDFGHRSGYSYKEMLNKYKNGEITLDELKDFQTNPNNYRLETPSANRSHKFE